MDAAFRALFAAALLAVPLRAGADLPGLFFAGPFPAAACFAEAFFAGDFFAAVFFAAAFFAGDFFAAAFFGSARSAAFSAPPAAGAASPAVALPPESLLGAESIEWTP
jgi:hypothetical protein